MAKYGKAAAKSVKSAMHREKRGTLKSGKGGKGGTVTSRKQAIAIGLSEAREKGREGSAQKIELGYGDSQSVAGACYNKSSLECL